MKNEFQYSINLYPFEFVKEERNEKAGNILKYLLEYIEILIVCFSLLLLYKR